MEYIFLLIVLIFSVVFHEVSHGVVANYLGDPTAKNAGRLTLNPIPHIDPIGSVILPGILLLMNLALSGQGIIFGWAKPVPINPYNFRDQKYGAAKVALAGPVSNLSLALVFGLTLRFFPAIVNIPGLYLMFSYIVLINLILAVFNLLPIPPLDGSHILFSILPPSLENIKSSLNQSGFLLVLLVIFFFFQWIGLIIAWLFKLIVGSPLP
jgi:Zn-dependent protease